jgi:hypothetical protein
VVDGDRRAAGGLGHEGLTGLLVVLDVETEKR